MRYPGTMGGMSPGSANSSVFPDLPGVGWFLVANRKWLALVGVLLTVASATLSGSLTFSTAIEAMVDRTDPALVSLSRLRRVFGSNEVVLATYDAPDLFTPEGLERLATLERSLASIPRVRSTTSLASTPLGAGIIDADSEQAVRLVELLEGYVVGADRRTAAVLCLLESPEETGDADDTRATESGDGKRRPSRADAIDAIRRRIAELPDGTVAGEPAMLRDGFAMLDRDGSILGVTAALLSAAVLFLVFRSVRWVLAPLVVVLASILGTRGLLAAAGFELTMVSAMLSSMITVVGIATTVHLIVEFRRRRAEGLSPDESLAKAISRLAFPVVGAIVTDCIGFGALMASGVGPVRDFGLMTAIGSAAVLLFGVLLLPSLALDGPLRIDPRRAWGEAWLDRGLERMVRLLTDRPWPVLAASSVVIGITAIGLWRLQVETDFVRNFRSDSPIARAYDVVESRLGGAGVWDLLVPFDGSIDARTLSVVENLETRLGALRTPDGAPALTKTLSLAGVIGAVSPVRLETLGESSLGNAVVAAAVGFVEQSLPEVTAALVGRDPSDGSRWMRIMLRSRERQPAASKRWIIEAVGREAAQSSLGDGNNAAEPTGVFVLLAGLVDRLLADSWLTLGVAVAGMFFLLAVAFRSPLLAMVALVPNLLPIVFVLGALGWAGLKINMGTAMIAAVSMGLSIDSSIHYIAAWGRRDPSPASRRDPLGGTVSIRGALDLAHDTAGRAIVFATLALVVGFLALCSSEFLPTVSFGGFAAVTLLGGMLGNLIVLPVLLAVLDTGSGQDIR